MWWWQSQARGGTSKLGVPWPEECGTSRASGFGGTGRRGAWAQAPNSAPAPRVSRWRREGGARGGVGSIIVDLQLAGQLAPVGGLGRDLAVELVAAGQHRVHAQLLQPVGTGTRRDKAADLGLQLLQHRFGGLGRGQHAIPGIGPVAL